MMRMAAVLVGVILQFHAAGAAAFDSMSKLLAHRAAGAGLATAHLVFEYALSDDCELARVRVLENSAQDILDGDAIDAVVAHFVGPFRGAHRTVYWPTDLGHHYIRCEFDASGSFAHATLSSGQDRLPGPVPERRIALRLSTLGTRTRTVIFSFRDGSLTWKATGR